MQRRARGVEYGKGGAMRRGGGLCLGGVVAVGVWAGAAPQRELADARIAFARAVGSPRADRVRGAIGEAEAALAAADREELEDPGGDHARDLAYVALRAAERARIAALYEADR